MRKRLKEAQDAQEAYEEFRAGSTRKKVAELGSREQVKEELEQILIEHKLAQLRKRRGLTQAALARRSGVSQPMIAQIESGKLANLTLKTLARTARALGASLKVDFVPQRTAVSTRRRPLARLETAKR